MAEGDTIHRLAALLRGALGEGPLAAFRFSGRQSAPLPTPGEEIEVRPLGKHLLISFGRGTTLHTHLGMTGSWRVLAAGSSVSPGGGTRVVIETPQGTAVCRSAPVVELLDAAGVRRHPVLSRLGPDLCVPDPDFGEGLLRLARSDQERAIGDALLDQTVACGIGNVYRSEVLWARRVDPSAPTKSIDDEVRRSLLRTGHELLRRNLGAGPRRTVSQGLAVYGRGGRPCLRCGARIEVARTGAHARSVWWCPTCQTHFMGERR